MKAIEDRLRTLVEDNCILLLGILVTIVSMIVRWNFRLYVSPDMSMYLLNWYEELGGIKGLTKDVGDYNLLYQLYIALLYYVPINPIVGIKALSVIFDYLLAILVGYIVKDITNDKSKGIIAYSIILIAPYIVINSSMWGQSDSIYSFFVIAAIYALIKEKNFIGLILFGVGLSFKLQAIFALPFIIFLYLKKKNFSIVRFLIIPMTMIIVNLPVCIMGKKSVFETFLIYVRQSDEYFSMYLSYPSFWVALVGECKDTEFGYLKGMAIWTTIAIIGLVAVLIIKWTNNKMLNIKQYVIISYILIYSAVIFMPLMHERYGFVFETIGIILIFCEYRFVIPVSVLHLVTLRTYGAVLLGVPCNMALLGYINIIVYAVSIYFLYITTKRLDNIQS